MLIYYSQKYGSEGNWRSARNIFNLFILVSFILMNRYLYNWKTKDIYLKKILSSQVKYMEFFILFCETSFFWPHPFRALNSSCFLSTFITFPWNRFSYASFSFIVRVIYILQVFAVCWADSVPSLKGNSGKFPPLTTLLSIHLL